MKTLIVLVLLLVVAMLADWVIIEYLDKTMREEGQNEEQDYN